MNMNKEKDQLFSILCRIPDVFLYKEFDRYV